MTSIILDGSFVRVPIAPPLKTKVQIVRGNHVDTYILSKNKERNVFPLQYGNGLYTVKIYQAVNYKKNYVLIQTQTFNAVDTSKCWLEPSQKVWYDDNIRILSDKINRGKPASKLLAYYNYCYKTIRYNCIQAFIYRKDINYLPDLTKVIKRKSGNSFDKAALFCALCRLNGIECKLVIGYVNKKTCHAWCQVKLDGKWRSVDPTLGRKYKITDYEVQYYS